MSDEIFFDGQRFISAAEASSTADLSRDYVARLCRDGKVKGRRIGKNWYVHEDSLKHFLIEQSHAKEVRRGQLSNERSKEYLLAHRVTSPTLTDSRPVIQQNLPLTPTEHSISIRRDDGGDVHSARVTEGLTTHALHVQRALHKKALARAESALRFAPSMLATPSGVHEAVVRTLGHNAMHVPVHTLTPFAEFLQKFVALLVAFSMTFGTYALVDPSYARFAMDSIQSSASTVADAYVRVTGGGASALAERSRDKMFFAAENPNAALAQVSGAALAFIPDTVRDIARAINSGIDDLVYAIAFPDSVTSSLAHTPIDGASVSVEIAPYARGTQSTSLSVTLAQAPATQANAPVGENSNSTPITIVERRVETERIVSSVGGITEDYLNQRLNTLESQITSRLLGASSGGGGGYTTINNNYQMIAQSNNIDKLGSVTIENSTFSGGTITGATITGGSVAADVLTGVVSVGSGGTGTSTSPTFGQVLLGNASGTYDLVATSSLGFLGAVLSDANTWTALQLFSAGASSTNFSNFGTAYFGGTATTTIDSAGNLSVAGTLGVTGSTTLANATTTNLFSTTASSTNLFSTTASFGSLSVLGALTQTGLGTFQNGFVSQASSTIVGTFTNTGAATFGSTLAASGLATFSSGLLSTASSTIGDGTQAGGLTISGGATTTGDFIISKASAPTTGSLYFGNGTANLNYNSSDFTFTGGSIYTNAGRIVSIGNNETIGLGVRYVNGDGTYYVGATHDASPDLVFTNNGLVERARLTNSGNFGIGTTTPWAKLSISANNGETNTRIFDISSSTASATTSLFTIRNTGNIGIGTSTPTNRLEVAGNTFLGGNLTATGTLGVVGAATLSSTLEVTGDTTLSNATTTNLFSTTASSTNLFSTNASFGSLSVLGALTQTGLGTFQNGFVSQASSTVVGAFTSTGLGTFARGAFTATSGTTTIAAGQGLTIGDTKFVVQESTGNIGIGTAAPTTALDIGVTTRVTGDLTIAGGSALTISASGPVNQTGTGQVTFAGNLDATNGLDVTNANFTVGGSNFTVAQATGNTSVAGTLGLTGALSASSTLQVTGATRVYSTLWTGGALTASAAGTGLSVTNDASVGGTFSLTGAATFGSTLAVSGLLTAATTTFTGDVALSGKKITGLGSPTADGDAANKTYVDSVAQGLSLKDSVVAGTTANITLSGEQTVDGVALVAGNRVLVKDQADLTKNGIYIVSSGVWSRAADADEDSEVSSGMFAFITDGTENASSGWVLTTTGAITLGTSLLSFTQFSGAGQIVAGTGITKTGNTLDVIGTADRITANADSIDIASTYVGQSSITTVGALTSGSIGSGFGNINIGASSITGGVATFSSIVGSAINGTGDLTINGSGTFSNGLSVVGTLSAATTSFSGNVALGGKKITGLADPTSAQEAATKAYVDAIAQGLTVKASVRVATTSNITLSGTQTIDGVALTAGNRVLVMGQSTASQNGIYAVAAGAWSRSTDADENSEVATGMYSFVEEGTAYSNTGWSLITSGSITLDTTSLSFTQFSGSAETTAGDGLTKSGNTISAAGTADRISVTADAIDIASTYAGQSSILTVGTLTSGAIGSGFGAINIGSSALTAGAAVFSSATSYGTLSIGATATTSIVGNSATSTFSGGISLAAGNVNIATGGRFLINDSLVLSATGLGSSVVGSSLTSVGALDSGSITTGFGAINIGSDTLDAGATTLTSLSVSGLSTLTRASTTRLSNYGMAYFGSTATSTFDSTGFLTLPSGFLSQASSTIGSGAQAGGLTISGGATTTGNAYFVGNVGIGTSTPWGKLAISTAAQQDGSLPLLNIASTTNTSLFTVLGNGNVGIGYDSPVSALQLDGGASAVNSRYTTSNTGRTTIDGLLIGLSDENGSARIWNYEGSPISFGTTNVERLRISQSGGLSIGSTFSSTNAAANNVIIEGLLGVGTTSPTNKFEVAGNTFLGGNLTATGTLSVAGASTFSSTLAASGLATLSSGFVSQASSTVVGAFTTTGTNTFGGALNITGAITSTATTANTFPYASSTALSVSGTSYFGTASTTNLTVSGVPSAVLVTNSSGVVAAASAQTCTNQFIRSLSAAYVATCASIASTDFANADWGDMTVSGGVITLDADTVSDSEIDYATVTLADFTNDADYVKWASATSTLWKSAGLLSTASSTIGDGTQAGGLTVSGGATTTGNLIVQGSATSTFSNGISSTYLNITGTGATSTFASGINLSGGCLAVNGTCVGGSSGATTGAANVFTALQTFSAGASTTQLSVFQKAYFGGTATSTFNSDGSLTMVAPITSTATSANTFPYASSTALTVSGTGYFGTASSSNLTVSSLTSGRVPFITTAGAFTDSSAFTFDSSLARLTVTNASTTAFSVSGNAYFAGSGIWNSSGSLGVGTTSPYAKFSVQATGGQTNPVFEVASSSDSTPYFTVTSSGNAGFGTSTPQKSLVVAGTSAYSVLDFTNNALVGQYEISENSSANPGAYFRLVGTNNPGGPTRTGIAELGAATSLAFRVNSNTEAMRIDSAGNLGIGTTSPFRLLSVTSAVATAQAALSYDTTRNTDFLTDSAGDLTINPSGDDVRLNDDNLWVCSGGSCPSGTPSGTGKLIVETALGVGTSTPVWPLTASHTTLPQLSLTDGSATSNAWTFRSVTNTLYIATSTASATSTVAAVTITPNGRFGIGTSTPTTLLSVGGLLSVGASSTGQLARMGTATSTFNGDIKITGKLDVGTIDPVYTIGGTKYATYGHSTVGIKEETVQTIHLEKADDGSYAYTIDFDSLKRGSDLWLFYQITDFGKNWNALVVSLTPSFDGTVYYKKNIIENTLTIKSDKQGEVSMRLVGNRFDFSKWANLRSDQDGDTSGTHVIPEKSVQ